MSILVKNPWHWLKKVAHFVVLVFKDYMIRDFSRKIRLVWGEKIIKKCSNIIIEYFNNVIKIQEK